MLAHCIKSINAFDNRYTYYFHHVESINRNVTQLEIKMFDANVDLDNYLSYRLKYKFPYKFITVMRSVPISNLNLLEIK